MTARAMKIVKLKVELKAGDVEKLLAGFKDAGNVGEYAKSSLAACVKTGIVSGKNGNLIGT